MQSNDLDKFGSLKSALLQLQKKVLKSPSQQSPNALRNLPKYRASSVSSMARGLGYSPFRVFREHFDASHNGTDMKGFCFRSGRQGLGRLLKGCRVEGIEVQGAFNECCVGVSCGLQGIMSRNGKSADADSHI